MAPNASNLEAELVGLPTGHGQPGPFLLLGLLVAAAAAGIRVLCFTVLGSSLLFCLVFGWPALISFYKRAAKNQEFGATIPRAGKLNTMCFLHTCFRFFPFYFFLGGGLSGSMRVVTQVGVGLSD